MIARRALISTGLPVLFAGLFAGAAGGPEVVHGGRPGRAAGFARDGDTWKIDDIKGPDDGWPWSIRGLLETSLKP